MTKIDDLIAAGELLPFDESHGRILIELEEFDSDFYDAAANAREDIKAMREENKRLREALVDARIWFDMAIKGDLMSAKNAGLIHRKLKQALEKQ